MLSIMLSYSDPNIFIEIVLICPSGCWYYELIHWYPLCLMSLTHEASDMTGLVTFNSQVCNYAYSLIEIWVHNTLKFVYLVMTKRERWFPMSSKSQYLGKIICFILIYLGIITSNNKSIRFLLVISWHKLKVCRSNCSRFRD